jgi:hypothetical protein
METMTANIGVLRALPGMAYDGKTIIATEPDVVPGYTRLHFGGGHSEALHNNTIIMVSVPVGGVRLMRGLLP